MKEMSHSSSLLSVAVVLILLGKSQVKTYVVVSSSSSGSGQTSCDGLLCSYGTNCMSFSNLINGNFTSDKRCTDFHGKIVRQETVSIADGEKCVKNLTMLNKEVKVDHYCRKLTNVEREDFAYRESQQKRLKLFEEAIDQEQEALEDEIDWFRDNLYQSTESRIDALHKEIEVREKINDLKKDIYEAVLDARHEVWELRMDALEDQIERDQDDQEDLLEFAIKGNLWNMRRARNFLRKRNYSQYGRGRVGGTTGSLDRIVKTAFASATNRLGGLGI